MHNLSDLLVIGLKLPEIQQQGHMNFWSWG